MPTKSLVCTLIVSTLNPKEQSIYDNIRTAVDDDEGRGISQYKLIKEYHISTGQLDRLRKNGNVSTYTLDQLCRILDCRLEDIAEYVEK